MKLAATTAVGVYRPPVLACEASVEWVQLLLMLSSFSCACLRGQRRMGSASSYA
jgi:hypothetical protein